VPLVELSQTWQVQPPPRCLHGEADEENELFTDSAKSPGRLPVRRRHGLVATAARV